MFLKGVLIYSYTVVRLLSSVIQKKISIWFRVNYKVKRCKNCHENQVLETGFCNANHGRLVFRLNLEKSMPTGNDLTVQEWFPLDRPQSWDVFLLALHEKKIQSRPLDMSRCTFISREYYMKIANIWILWKFSWTRNRPITNLYK